MTLCYLGLGSNLKTPQRQIRLALQQIKKIPQSALLKTAPLYLNPPWGFKAQPPFCNTVVKMHTTLSAKQLLLYCQQIENSFGRVRKKRWGPRILDIDILIFGHLRCHSPTLSLPHPYMLERDFVMTPYLAICDP